MSSSLRDSGDFCGLVAHTKRIENEHDDEHEQDWEITLNRYSRQATIAPSLRNISQQALAF